MALMQRCQEINGKHEFKKTWFCCIVIKQNNLREKSMPKASKAKVMIVAAQKQST
jgi:hypothetical protein